MLHPSPPWLPLLDSGSVTARLPRSARRAARKAAFALSSLSTLETDPFRVPKSRPAPVFEAFAAAEVRALRHTFKGLVIR